MGNIKYILIYSEVVCYVTPFLWIFEIQTELPNTVGIDSLYRYCPKYKSYFDPYEIIGDFLAKH